MNLYDLETVASSEVRENIRTYLERASNLGHRVVITRHSKPVAAIIPYLDLQRLEEEDRVAFYEMMAEPDAGDKADEGVNIADLLETEKYPASKPEPEAPMVKVVNEAAAMAVPEMTVRKRKKGHRASPAADLTGTRIPFGKYMGAAAFSGETADDYSHFITGQVMARLVDAQSPDHKVSFDEIQSIVARSIRDTLDLKTAPNLKFEKG